jgi:hypothetical protein
MLQARAAFKGSDRGDDAHPEDTGYQRIFAAPALELTHENWRLYADVALPIYENFHGNQLAATSLLKVLASFSY